MHDVEDAVGEDQRTLSLRDLRREVGDAAHLVEEARGPQSGGRVLHGFGRTRLGIPSIYFKTPTAPRAPAVLPRISAARLRSFFLTGPRRLTALFPVTAFPLLARNLLASTKRALTFEVST